MAKDHSKGKTAFIIGKLLQSINCHNVSVESLHNIIEGDYHEVTCWTHSVNERSTEQISVKVKSSGITIGKYLHTVKTDDLPYVDMRYVRVVNAQQVLNTVKQMRKITGFTPDKNDKQATDK